MKEKFTLVVPAKEKFLGVVRGFLTAPVEGRLQSADVSYLELCLNEICENIIEHGYKGGGGKITIRLVIEIKKVVITVIDRAAPFNIIEYKPPDKKVLLEQGINGKLGIRAIKNICDKIYYKRLKGKNRLTLVKKI